MIPPRAPIAGGAILCASSSLLAADSGDETRALVSEMLADAQSRSSLLGDSGHDGNFFLQDARGDFRLEVTGYLQFRYVAAFRDAPSENPGSQALPLAADLDDDFDGSFQMRRARLTFQGHVFDPSLEFTIKHSFDRSDGESSLSDGYIRKTWDSGWSLRFGQFKLPFLFEELTSAQRQLTVERSTTNRAFTLSRSQGVELGYEGQSIRAWAAYSDGARSANFDVGDNQTDWALTARVEWLAAGESFRPFRFGGAIAGAPLSWLIGAAVHAEDNDLDDQFGGRIFSWTADTALRSEGWSLSAAVMSKIDSAGNAGESAHDWGALIQGSILAGDLEPFLRYDLAIPDRDRAANDNFSTVTLGFNYFIHGHAMKLTLDAQWSLDDPTNTEIVEPSTASGLRAADGDHQVAIRAQFQVVF